MVTIYDKQELLLSSDADVFRQQLSTVLSCMRGELDDHRVAINENTDEVVATNDFLNELSRKLDKLTERVDDLVLHVKGEKVVKEFTFKPLTEREKEVFQALYVLTESQPYASYEQIARKSLLSKSMVMDHVTCMIEKGLPVMKKRDGNRIFMRLDPEFRQLQAKKNIVGVTALLTAWLPR